MCLGHGMFLSNTLLWGLDWVINCIFTPHFRGIWALTPIECHQVSYGLSLITCPVANSHPKTNRTMEDTPWMKMYFLLKMGIFQCHGSFVGCTAAFSGRQLDFGASKLWNCPGFEGHLICGFTPNSTTTTAIYSRLAMFWTMSHWILWMSFGIIWKSSLWLKTTSC